MKQLQWTGPEQMMMTEASHSELAPGEVRIRVFAAGICGSDLSGYLGHNSLRKPPLVMGHELSGSVADMAADVEDLSLGDRVTVNPLLSCGRCALCVRGQDNLCVGRRIIGIHRPGAFAEYVDVPARACERLPDRLDLLSASLTEPLACATRAVRLSGAGPGDRVLVLGAGGLGLLVLAVVLQAGATAVGVVDTNPARLVQATEWGASVVADPRGRSAEELAEEIGDGLGVDVALDAVGAPVTRQVAVAAVSPGGRAVFLGLHEDETLLRGNDVVRREVEIRGSFCYTRVDFAAALRLLAAGRVRTTGAWIEERPLADGPASFAELVKGRSAVAKVVLCP